MHIFANRSCVLVEWYFAIKIDLEIKKEFSKNPEIENPCSFFSHIFLLKNYLEILGSNLK